MRKVYSTAIVMSTFFVATSGGVCHYVSAEGVVSERGSKLKRLTDRYIGVPLTLPAAVFRLFERQKTEKFNTIAILCMGAIGDVLLLSALINGLKKKNPKITIDLYVTQDNAEAANLVSGIDNIYSFGLSQIVQMIVAIRRKKYDLLIDSTQWARLGAIVSAFSRAKTIVGFQTKGQYRSLPYEITVSHSNKRHEWENFVALGRAVFPDLDGKPTIKSSPLLANINIPTGRYIVCHMWTTGSHKFSRRWGDDKWAQLIHILVSNDYNVVLTGSSEDRENSAMYGPQCVNMAGVLTLSDLTAVLSAADGLISVNTGVMHMGALLSVPTVGIHGPTNPLRWGPVGDMSAAVCPEGAEMTLNLGFEKACESTHAKNVDVDIVWETFRGLTAKRA